MYIKTESEEEPRTRSYLNMTGSEAEPRTGSCINLTGSERSRGRGKIWPDRVRGVAEAEVRPGSASTSGLGLTSA